MKFGLHLGYWQGSPPPMPQLADLIERLDSPSGPITSLWTAEAYGSDAFTPLTWWASRTQHLQLGTGIAQIAARTPAMTAMSAQTLDHLSGGRLRLGLGVSGPQVVQGWHGQPFERPLAQMREYVEILRKIWAREAPLTHNGQHYQLPLDGTKALRSTVHPLRPAIPTLIAAQGPKNIELAAEIADGWLPAFFSPADDAWARTHLDAGFARRPAPAKDFAVCPTIPVAIGPDAQVAADALRPQFALYIAGMGSFHRQAIERRGFEEVCEQVHALYHSGDRARAAAVVPLELLAEFALVGTPEMVAQQLQRWRATCATELLLQPALVTDWQELLVLLAQANA